jgi:hypothetical protein
MLKLNFPSYTFRFKKEDDTALIFDKIRKKFVVLTPEEWVRQHTIRMLIEEKNLPKSHINVEKQIVLNKLKKRYDIVVFNSDGSIFLIVECKAPHIKTSQTTFDQIAQYNFVLNARYLMVTNGLAHYYCRMDFEEQRYHFLSDLPEKTS